MGDIVAVAGRVLAESGMVQGRLALQSRLEPQGDARLEWICKPEKRGQLRVQLVAALVAAAFSFAVSLVLVKAIDLLCGGFCVEATAASCSTGATRPG